MLDKNETSGVNQSGLRDRNERLVLTILRREGALPKAEIARRTGLSAQTVSVIMRGLEAEGLLQKGAKLRGKVGQPSVPMALAPEGAFFFGLKVGRRSVELVLVDFVGEELGHITQSYAFPTPTAILAFVREGVAQLCLPLSGAQRGRIAGLGIAVPYFLWEWAEVIGVDPAKMAAWEGFDLRGAVAGLVDFPVILGNDATSACGAELVFGTAPTPPEFLYIYIGYFVGGGVVLNSTLYPGRLGNAGAIGTFPLGQGEGRQLVDAASLIGLERRLIAAQGDARLMEDPRADWEIAPVVLQGWLAEALPALALLIQGACSIIDFPIVLVDGNMPGGLRDQVVTGLRQALAQRDLSGLVAPEIVAGSLGPRARPLGAASLPLSSRFLLEA